jgi:hypothetical protein
MVQGSGVPYFIVGLGDLVDQGYLEQLAASSRGRLLLAPGPGALAGLYQDIASILRHQYIVTLDGSELAAGEALALRIGVTSGGTAGVAEASFQVPGEPSPVPTRPPERTPAPTQAITPAPPPLETEEGGGSSLAPLVAALVAGGLATTGVTGYLLWRRQRRVEQPAMDVQRFRDASAPPPSFPAIEAAVHSDPTAYLQVTADDGSEQYPLGDWPVTVGFSSDCSLRLPERANADSERVRIWRREGRYMLHNLSRMGTVLVAGKPASWAILEDGDEVQIGPVRLLFRDRPPVPQA